MTPLPPPQPPLPTGSLDAMPNNLGPTLLLASGLLLLPLLVGLPCPGCRGAWLKRSPAPGAAG